MDILPIQDLAVPCEPVFSSAKETMSTRRNHITPELMEVLQLLKFSVKHGQDLNFTYGYDWTDELIQLEILGETRGQALEDLSSFKDSLSNA